MAVPHLKSLVFQGLDEEQSVQLLQCYLQEDYRGTRDSVKVCGLCQLLSAAFIRFPLVLDNEGFWHQFFYQW